MSLRRLPIYLLLDCSESMAGKGIQQVEKAIRGLHDGLMNDPLTLEWASISVITFNSEQIEVFPLKKVAEFKPPELKASGTAALGAVLELVATRIETELKKPTEEQEGDFRPSVFIMSAFKPTDNWKKGLDEFNLIYRNVIALAVDGANLDLAHEISETVLVLNDMNYMIFGAFFAPSVEASINYEGGAWPPYG